MRTSMSIARNWEPRSLGSCFNFPINLLGDFGHMILLSRAQLTYPWFQMVSVVNFFKHSRKR